MSTANDYTYERHPTGAIGKNGVPLPRGRIWEKGCKSPNPLGRSLAVFYKRERDDIKAAKDQFSMGLTKILAMSKRRRKAMVRRIMAEGLIEDD